MSSEPTSASNHSLSYAQTGVDIDAGKQLVDHIKPLVRETFRSGVLSGLGGFGALFELPMGRYSNPVLVSGTDGVGTKLKLAMQINKHDTIGIDLVAMCVNDIVVTGAEPLFFLDYYATGKLSVEQATKVIGGIAHGCELAGCALTGGETAEMPGMYEGEDYDLAGFSVGIVEKSAIIQGNQVQSGDILLGLASSGPHSNGYSLIRKVIEISNADLQQPMDDQSLGQALLTPTRIYVKSLLALTQSVKVHALAHITGGGLSENIPRVLPPGTEALLNTDNWQRSAVFDWLQQQGNISKREMLRTFNYGIGMVVCVSRQDTETATRILQQQGEIVYPIGHIQACDCTDPRVKYETTANSS